MSNPRRRRRHRVNAVHHRRRRGHRRNPGGSTVSTLVYAAKRTAVAADAYARGCAQCLALGDRWVHLRTCRTCGHVGCCDSSKNKHATKHYKALCEHLAVQAMVDGLLCKR